MELLKTVFGPVLGFTFAFVVFMTSLFGNYIITLLLPMITVFNRHRQWRELMDRAVTFWTVIPLFFLKFVFRIKVRVTGDEILYDKAAVVVMNHRTRLDWLYYWMVLWRMNPWLATTNKIALKQLLRHVPGVGFGMQVQQFIFLKRDLEVDLKRLTRAVEYYSDMNRPYQILMFPEGTDRTAFTLKRSSDFAKKNGLKELKNVLYPRSAGFLHLVKEMRRNDYLEYIYDVTIAYPKDIVQNETDMVLKGSLPSEVHYHIKRYHINEIPRNEEELNHWLHKVWYEKEERLEQFYAQKAKNKRQFNCDDGFVWLRDDFRQNGVVFYGLLFWVSMVCAYFYHFTFMPFVQCTLVFLILNYVYVYGRYGSMERLIYTLWEKTTKRVHVV
ncbi:unnamed protein product [Bursaphelenchus okinawaensis]|uniref:Phospholipid/glycerol acyltransferase domain-containing protein n=1 Tax=Bursaphelenchus okinawaensis TaxID=465554 RepID=A0A811LA73_9BILA|nr:unnamed protein product [Bursaphelenchus okinawaensis]CAG9119732.1 unnamed protein product [Bursaphelenchus okinawaensis]